MRKEVRLDVVSRLFDDKGDETSVGLTFDNVVVEVHKSQFHDTLYYSLGKIDLGVPETLKQDQIGGGKKPAVAVNGTPRDVVEVHERSKQATLGYRVGHIRANDIAWGDDIEYDRGGYTPSVAVEERRAIAVHSTAPDIGDLYYTLGTIDPTTRTVKGFNPNFGARKFGTGGFPGVAMANGHVVVVYTTGSAGDYRLESVAGRLSGDSITWGSPAPLINSGLTGAVAMTADGFVLFLYSDQEIENPRFYSRAGRLDTERLTVNLLDFPYVINRTSELEPRISPLFAVTFAIAMNDTIALETVSDSNSYLGSSSSFLLARATWMEDNFAALAPRELHEITFPGSHDAATYKIADCSKFIGNIGGHPCNSRTQRNSFYEQLRSGVRYFDVRPVYFNGGITTGHFGTALGSIVGCNGAPLTEVLDDVNQFVSEAGRELVILKFSHYLDRQRNVFNFTRSQKSDLVQMVRATLGRFFYTGAIEPGGFPYTRIDKILAGDRGVVLPVFDQFGADKDLLGNGTYSYADYQDPNHDRDANLIVYDCFAEKNAVDKVYDDQLAKLKAQYSAPMFLFSATLTQDIAQAGGCPTSDQFDNIVTLAAKGNGALGRKFIEYYRKGVFTHFQNANIVYVDLASDFATDVSIFLNRRRYLGDILRPGEYLIPGDTLYSARDFAKFVYREDGYLVFTKLTGDGRELFKRPLENPRSAWRCIMQYDGNFVVYKDLGTLVYASDTGGNSGAFLKVQDDDKVVIYRKDGTFLKQIAPVP